MDGLHRSHAAEHVKEQHILDRRSFCLAGSLWLIAGAAEATRPAKIDAVNVIEREAGGRLGVFAVELETGRTFTHRADERFKLFSTFKALLAAMVLAETIAGRQSLNTWLPFAEGDLLPASPVTSAHVREGGMSIQALCEAIMYRSDNTAANVLMRHLGGPARLTAFLRTVGDDLTRVDSYEGDKTERPAFYDTTTPRAFAQTAHRLMFGDGLPVTAAGQLKRWMEGNIVGKSRLRARFPASWRSGDRTGTGDGWCNDVAFAERPLHGPLIVAAFYEKPGMELEQQEAVLRDVASAVVGWQAPSSASTM